ncbi:MAG: hypothetical protein J5654_10785 [Victivallales bacterium]|nr:hypothetical protein [Victivallales bacterium]
MRKPPVPAGLEMRPVFDGLKTPSGFSAVLPGALPGIRCAAAGFLGTPGVLPTPNRQTLLNGF